MKINFNFKLAVFAAALISGHGLDYSDLEATNVTCPEYDSCAERNESVTYGRKDCECDANCVTFNDCCIDARRDSIEKGSNTGRFICVQYEPSYKYGAYLIKSCQQNWEGPNEVKRLCEVSNDLSDPLTVRPVTDIQRGFIYRNRYCAECNNAVPNDLSPWKIHIDCNIPVDKRDNYSSNDLVFSSDLNEWGVTMDNIYYPCRLLFKLPESHENKIRECKASIIGTCPRTWHDVQIKEMCEAYLAIIRYDDKMYRNPHCALCNGASPGQMKCGEGILGMQGKPWVGTLFDVNQSDGDVVGVKVPEKPSCPNGEKYDPFYKKCRESGCGLPDYIMINGECVKP